MPPSLSELKATPSFCFPFKIPDDLTATNVPVHCTAESWLVQSQGKLSMAKRAAVTKWIGHGPPSQKIDSFITSMFSFFFSPSPKYSPEMCLVSYIQFRGCQNGMQEPQLCAKPCNFSKLNMATSRMAFLGLNLHVLQAATPNSNN